MQIDSKLLSEDNYTGTRRIKLTNKKLLELKKKLNEYQQEANPFIDEMEEIMKAGLDEKYQKIQALQKEILEIQNEMKPDKEKYDEVLKKVQAIDTKAQVIKNKMQPLVDKELDGQLAEFEKAIQLVEEDGDIYVEIVDEVEEFIKKKREANEHKPEFKPVDK